MRPRPAPRAERTAISRARAVARASRGWRRWRSTGAARSRRRPAGRATSSAGRWPDDAGAERFDDRAGPIVALGIFTAPAGWRSTVSSAWAASIVTPGFSRATTSKPRKARILGTSGNLRRERPDLGGPRELHARRRRRRRRCGAGRSAAPGGRRSDGSAPNRRRHTAFAEHHHARRRVHRRPAGTSGRRAGTTWRTSKKLRGDGLALRGLDRTVRRGQQRTAADAALDGRHPRTTGSAGSSRAC